MINIPYEKKKQNGSANEYKFYCYPEASQVYMWRRAEHPALWVYRARSSPVLWPFLGNFLWARLGRTMSKAHHLVFRRYVINGCSDIKCDVTAPHMHQSHDLLL